MIFEERARDRMIFLQVCDPCSFEIFDYVRKKIIYKKPWIRLFDPFSISLRGFIFGKSSISSKKKIVCSKSKFSFLCKRYNRFLHDSFYKKNNFIDWNSNCPIKILSFLYDRLKFKITRILFLTTKKKKREGNTRIPSCFHRSYERSPDACYEAMTGVTIRRELEKLRVAFRRAAA